MYNFYKVVIKCGSSNAPHEGEADLKGWGVVLKADNHREEEGRDEVGHGDNN